MTDAPPRQPGAPAGWLLRQGARAAISSVVPLLALAAVQAIAVVTQRTLWPALVLGDPVLRLAPTLLVAGAGLLFTAALARAVILAVAVRSGATRMRTGNGLEGPSPERAGLRGIAWAAAAAIVDLFVSTWFWAALVSSVLALVLGGPVVSLLGAIGVALVLTLGLFVGAASVLWLELALVVSVVRQGSVARAGTDAFGLLLGRPGFPIWAWLITAVPAALAAMGVQVLAAGAPAPSVAAACASGVALLLVALIKALGMLLRLDALAAMALAADGALRAPPPVPVPRPPIPRATLVGPEVVEARPVGPMTPWNPGASG
jgi:hypothetical protein